MKKYPNWEDVQEAGNFDSLKPGGYIAKIINVVDNGNKEYLEILFDIADGEFKDYYKKLFDSRNFWGGRFYKSYKESVINFFKGFTIAVENSNFGYKWDFDEQKLKGKLIGVVLREEEYVPTQGEHAGEVRTKLGVQEVRSVDEIRKGNFKVKDKKVLETKQQQSQNSQDSFKSIDIMKDDIQF